MKLFQFSRAIRTHLPRFIRKYSNKKNKCCKIDPCPKCPDPDPPKIVQEKKCVPCCFTNWKPKPPICYRAQLSKRQYEDFRPKSCKPGMVNAAPPPDPMLKAKQIDPFKKNLCLKPQKRLVRKQAVEPQEKINLPPSDWDANC